MSGPRFFSGELIAEKHTGSPGDNWRSCAFGPHPRILFFATPERVNILDLRVSKHSLYHIQVLTKSSFYGLAR